MSIKNDILHKNSYHSIDLFKFVFSFLVITIHCSPFLVFGETTNLAIVSTFSRVAVPFFFACSGFLFFGNLKYKNDKILNCKSNRKILYRYVSRIFLLYTIYSVVYLTIQIPDWYSTGWLSFNAFVDYSIAVFRSSSYYHLWYLLDLVYATVFIYMIMSFFKRKIIYVLAIFLYFFGVIVYSYNWVSINNIILLENIANLFPALWDSVTRAFPLMIVGILASRCNKINDNRINFLFFAISFVFLCIEFYLINTLSVNHNKFSYIIFTLPCSYFLFSWVLNLNIKLAPNKSKTLRNMSTLIYCIHPLFIYLYSLNNLFVSFNSILQYFFIAITSTLVAYCIVKVSNYKYLKCLKIFF